MGDQNRFDIFFEKHIGIGLRWDNHYFALHLSFSIPFLTFTVGIGKRK
jgi:hypothetical protein